MPSVFRKDNKKKNLIYQLPVIFSKIQLQHNISAGDFPDCAKMQVGLSLPFQFSLLDTSGRQLGEEFSFKRFHIHSFNIS